MGNAKDKSINDILWADDDDDDIDPPRTAQSIALAQSVELAELLAQMFPDGTPTQQSDQFSCTVGTRMGDNWVGFVGTTTKGYGEHKVDVPPKYQWAAYWRQHSSVSFSHKNPARSKSRPQKLSTWKAQKAIKDFSKVGGWLSWVYREICKSAVETIRISIHPDQFMGNSGAAFSAAHDLNIIHAQWGDFGDIVVQQLPWKKGTTPGSFIRPLLHHGKEIGTLGLQLKDGTWRYGGKVDVGQISPLFQSKLKFKDTVTETIVATNDEAIKRAEEMYAKRMTEWLMQHSGTKELRHS